MKMGIVTTKTDFFGLDIGTTAIRVVQTKGGKNKSLATYNSIEIDHKLSKSDSNADLQKLGQSIKKLVSESGISTKNVVVGIPSARTFTTVVDIERLNKQELDRSIRLQADSLIPTPLDESKIDWALLGDSPTENSKVEILLSSVHNSYVEKRLDMLEGIGLNVIAFEPDSLAITRSISNPEILEPQLILDMGSESSDLIITLNGSPRLTRSIPAGTDSVIKAAIQNLGIDENQAKQFVYKFGLSKDKLEGQIYNAIIGTMEVLNSEVEKSIKFFQTRYVGKNISKIIVTGGASILPEYPLMLANKFGVEVEIGNCWRNLAFPATKQNELLAVSNKYAVAAGLAERVE